MERRALRIVQVSTLEEGGGAERTALALHQHYRKLGHESTLVVKVKKSDDPDVLAIDNSGRDKTLLGKLKCMLERRLGWEGLSYPGSHRLPELIGHPWDILHLHNLHGEYFDIAALPALTRLAPTVLTLHDSWTFTGHCACPLGCSRWQEGCGSCPDLRRSPRIRRDGTRFNLRRKRKYIGRSRLWLAAPSQWMLNQAKRSYLADKPMRVVRVGVDLDFFHPGSKAEARARLGLPQDRRILLFCAYGGLMNDLKDGPTLLKALAHLIARIPKALLVVVGGTGIPNEFQDLASHIEARRHEADRNRMADYYRAADVLAHATKSESAGMVPVEAMACGLPVVANRIGGLLEYVQEGESGFLSPCGDPVTLGLMLETVLTDGPASRGIGEQGVLTAKKYSTTMQADSYLRFYHDINRNMQARKGGW